MAEVTKKLHYRKGGVTVDISLYDSTSDMHSDFLSLRVGGKTVYAALGSAGEIEATGLKVRKGGVTYSVMKTNRYELPTGFIGIFDTTCPSGWTRETEFDNKFLKGGSAYGTIAGADTHSHNVTTPATNTTYTTPNEVDFSMYTQDIYAAKNAYHRHSLPSHLVVSGSASTLPAYINVVFCRKD